MTEPPAVTRAGAWVGGRAVSAPEAVRQAAGLLGRSRAAVVAGLGTDIAGARASVALAQAIGAAIDHMDADAALANLDVMRRAGWIVTTPLQARTRADAVLLVGPGLPAAWPDMVVRLALHDPPALVPDAARKLFHLGPGTDGPLAGAIAIEAPAERLLVPLAVLRALAAGRPTSLDSTAAAPLQNLAAALAQARFGVAVWAAGALDTLAVETLCGLIDDLNRTTRFAGLPLPAANNAEGVMQASAWATGFPFRTGFAGAVPVHDPWRFDARRMVASGEADAALWISAFAPTPPPWGDDVPTVALVAPGTEFRTPPAVLLEVGHPGIDHDSMLFNAALGGISFAAAASPRPTARVADTVAAIMAALQSC